MSTNAFTLSLLQARVTSPQQSVHLPVNVSKKTHSARDEPDEQDSVPLGIYILLYFLLLYYILNLVYR